MAQIAQRGCGVSILGGIQKSTGHRPGQPAVVDPALSKKIGLQEVPSNLNDSVKSAGTYPSPCFCITSVQ